MKSVIEIRKNRRISTAEKELFGSFAEHIGRCVYGGIYEPGHPAADKDGFRADLIEAVRDLGVTCVRYPGGNFLSDYNWKDGIGPKEKRPERIEPAWRQLEPNTFGVDEFMRWCEKSGVAPIMAVNMGTGTQKEAGELVEYCNHNVGSWAKERAKNGRKEPYGVRFWGVGNEPDGDWQICSMESMEYARKAVEAAKIMRLTDEKCKFIFCGSCSPQSANFPEWIRKVLETAYDQADYISLHAYYTYGAAGDVGDFLAIPVDLEHYINTAVSVCDYVKAVKRGRKDIMLALDEWNVWHNQEKGRDESPWTVGPPRLENYYDATDALAVGGLLSVIVNHSDRIKIGCMAQLVNVIAPILTYKGGMLVKQPIFYPFRAFAKRAAGRAVLRTYADIPTYLSARFGNAPYLHHSAVYDEKTGEYTVFVTNAGGGHTLTLDFGTDRVVLSGGERLTAKEARAVNTPEEPFRVVPQMIAAEKERRAVHTVTLPEKSFSVFVYKNL
ncbi:MAG: alpha-N-arabinofuranosidase [Clostridiales bacterium]|nr:alpha-N-arabinofuranosidase [Clostridiales bacterium]